MNTRLTPEFSVLGHPNEGKSAVVSTLAEDDSVKVSPTPGETRVCRTFPVRIDGKEIIRFTDTPGFQMPGETLLWMSAYDGPLEKLVAAFRAAHRNNPDFRNECELFGPVENGAGVIFVADGSRPVRKNDRMEMEILRLTGRPRMAIINSKDRGEGFVEDWKNEFRKSFNSVRIFNAHHGNFKERISLLESLKSIDQDWQPALDEVISAFRQDWKDRNIRTAEIICDLLVQCLGHTTVRNYEDAVEAERAKIKIRSVYQEEISKMEKRAFQGIRRLFKHNIFHADLPDQSIVTESLFSVRTWQVLGLTPVQLAAAAAVSGGVVGVGLDIAAHGLTFGVFTAIGSVLGAGSALLIGERLSKTRVIGMRLGGYRVSFGPVENMNFSYILLDRALIYYSYAINWAHGRRDYPDQGDFPHPTEKAGFSSGWGSREKKVCQSYFQAIRKKDDLQMENTRKNMVRFLLEAMDKISRSETAFV